MKKKFGFIIVILILFTGLEVYLMYSEKVPLSNRMYRVISGAPTVHLNHELLLYQGTFKTDKNYLVSYKKSDENIELYIASGIPAEMRPPWIFVPNGNDKSYRYSIPKPPFSY